MDELHEQRLTNWMLQNLRLTWVVTGNSSAFEKLIIADLCPPLNYEHATKSPYRQAMKSKRAELCSASAAIR